MKIWLPEIQVEAQPESWTEDGVETVHLYSLSGERLEWLENQLSDDEWKSVAAQVEEGVKRANEESRTDHMISMRGM